VSARPAAPLRFQSAGRAVIETDVTSDVLCHSQAPTRRLHSSDRQLPPCAHLYRAPSRVYLESQGRSTVPPQEERMPSLYSERMEERLRTPSVVPAPLPAHRGSSSRFSSEDQAPCDARQDRVSRVFCDDSACDPRIVSLERRRQAALLRRGRRMLARSSALRPSRLISEPPSSASGGIGRFAPG